MADQLNGKVRGGLEQAARGNITRKMLQKDLDGKTRTSSKWVTEAEGGKVCKPSIVSNSPPAAAECAIRAGGGGASIEACGAESGWTQCSVRRTAHAAIWSGCLREHARRAGRHSHRELGRPLRARAHGVV